MLDARLAHAYKRIWMVRPELALVSLHYLHLQAPRPRPTDLDSGMSRLSQPMPS